MIKSMKLSAKLIWGFSFLTLIGAIIGIFAMTQIKAIDDADTKMYKQMTVPLGEIGDMINYFQRMRVNSREVLIAETIEDKNKYINRFNELSEEFNKVAASFKSTLFSEAGKEIFKDMMKYKELYVIEATKVFDAWLANDKFTALMIMYGTAGDANKEVQKHIDEMQASKIGFAKQTAVENNEMAEMAFIVMTILIILGIIVSALLAFFIIKGVMRQLGADPMEVQAIANKVADGDLSSRIELKAGDNSSLLYSMEQMSKAILAMVNESKALAQAGVEGKLDKRADASQYKGEFKAVVSGVNATLDAVIGPLNVAAEYVDRISKGDIPPVITDNYNGDFNEIKQNLNQCITAVRLLVEDAAMLAKAAEEGRLSTRADAGRHQGDFRKIVQGVNNTLDFVIKPIDETLTVLEALSEGNLTERVRGNFAGDHAKLKEKLNLTLDSLPLDETMKVMKEVADGDLSIKMEGNYKGDSLQLKESVNDTIESLNNILKQVVQTVEEVTRGAMQVSDASTALSQGATEQAASLEEITSSMSEIGSQTRLNAENANMANSLSFDARDSAEKGNNEMAALNSAMNEINDSSKNISKIIKVIDEIAFQTNLLALNAAVEAARAGRHGKGFAVVAEEVRGLAARSATAAKETAELIENSIKTVDRGSTIAMKTGEALEEIKNASIKVADIISEINTSSNEQAQAISQINEGLTQIDKVTQTNTASAEESASASEQLSSQATLLRDLISKFKLDNSSSSYSSNSYRRKSIGSNQSKMLSGRHSHQPEEVIDLDMDFDFE